MVDVVYWINITALLVSVMAIEISSAVHHAIKKRDRNFQHTIDQLSRENEELKEIIRGFRQTE